MRTLAGLILIAVIAAFVLFLHYGFGIGHQ